MPYVENHEEIERECRRKYEAGGAIETIFESSIKDTNYSFKLTASGGAIKLEDGLKPHYWYDTPEERKKKIEYLKKWRLMIMDFHDIKEDGA